ncbi:MAG: hypothetical protein P8I55_06355 [Crocinitomix sp.]|nr:hypothetical protein [Crocinitomix sp.]
MSGSWIALMFLFINISVNAQDLPKDCFGKYGGEMPSYLVEVDGASIQIDKHDVFITISEDEVVYVGGNLELTGTYTVFKQSKHEYVIKSSLSNGKSLSYELSFIWDKKKDKIYITPKNGQSEAELDRLDD